MNIYDATEQAYKNGYAKGLKDARAEVVRCGKCKSYDLESDYCQFWHGVRHPGHYCGEGERRTDGN